MLTKAKVAALLPNTGPALALLVWGQGRYFLVRLVEPSVLLQ